MLLKTVIDRESFATEIENSDPTSIKEKKEWMKWRNVITITVHGKYDWRMSPACRQKMEGVTFTFVASCHK